MSFDTVYEKVMSWSERLSVYLGDSSSVIAKALNEGKSVLFEGAQGTMLDIDHGTYPYVTSSNPTCGGCSPARARGQRA